MDWFMNHYTEIIALIVALVALACLVDKLVPTPKKNNEFAKTMQDPNVSAHNSKSDEWTR